MKVLNLNIKERKAGEAVKDRGNGFVPGVLYGPKEKSVSINIPFGEFMSAWQKAGESTIVTLQGVGEDKDSLIHDVDVHPVSGKPLHVDFYVIEKGKKVTVDVPLEFIGVAPIEKSGEGIVVKVIHELEIEAMPKDLPHEIEVDLSGILDLESQILVKDLKLPEGVETTLEPDEVVVSATEAKEIEEPEPEDSEIDMDSIEVEEKGKKDEEGEGGEGEGDEVPKKESKKESEGGKEE